MARSTKQQARDRRAKIEAMRQAEAAKERRKSLLFLVVAVVVGLGLVAAAAIPAYLDSRNDPAKKDLRSFGVSAAKADCDDVVTDSATGNSNHQPDGTKVDYDTVPPSSGPHWSSPAFPARAFYTERDRPEMEQLVHNLEHGYTILWYDDTVRGAELDTLRDLAASAREKDETGGKFIVTAWDDSYGDFPAGKRIALAHWGAQEGYRQLCGGISGAVVDDFVTQYPVTDSPEPDAA